MTEYQSLYDPIVGASDGHGKEAAPTPEQQLRRTFALRAAYEELKTDLLDEVASIETRVLRPATDARECLAPIRKTIKKRENKRLDYEKCQDKVTKLQRKGARSAKEDAALSRAEEDLRNVAEEFHIADDHLRTTLPPIVAAAFSMVPALLAAHVLVQNRLLGLYYTTLHGYCEENGLPSPPPPMEDVIAEWSSKHKPIEKEVEAMTFIAYGKSLQAAPQSTGTEPNGRSLLSNYGSQDGFRRSLSSLIPSAATSNGNGSGNGSTASSLRIPSMNSISGRRSPSPSSASGYSPQPSPRIPPSPGGYATHLRPTDFTAATKLATNSGRVSPVSPSARLQSDYFSPHSYTQAVPSIGGGLAKKKPPPPPPKRIPSGRPEEFVVALYSFDGQGEGDLSFREGDRIKVVKKTETDQDWWTGELANGARGTFPANYCKKAV